MKFSQFFIPTSKDDPKDAVLKSHKLLVRAGYVQQVGAGIYNFLPLGKKILDQIRKIIKEEMDNAGAQEVLLGFVTPAELWRESGRFEKYGKELLRFKDRKDNDFVLGPTHEEMVTTIARNFVKSYKQLPLNFYQIHTKFRDEARPRFGLMRAREFVMKDGYSFHADFDDLNREFENMQAAYERIFTRLGLDFKIVEADSGAIGGSGSREFMVLADCGEDTLAVCEKCDYAANVEAAVREFRKEPRNACIAQNISESSSNDDELLKNAQNSIEQGDKKDFENLDSEKSSVIKNYPKEPPKAGFSLFLTPNVKTISDLCEFFKIDPFYIIKAVPKKAVFENLNCEKSAGGADSENLNSEIVIFFVRGDDELEETKALNALNRFSEQISESSDKTQKNARNYLYFDDLGSDDLQKADLLPGFIGPFGMGKICIFDENLKGAKNMVAGANKLDYHFVGVDFENIMQSIESTPFFSDIALVQEGDKCAKCGGNLHYTKGIEVGHIFKLGDKYSKALGAEFLDENGRAKPFVMGCYGIGVTRLMPAILEQKADELGCVWGQGVSAFDVAIIVGNVKDEAQMKFASELYENLKAQGVDVLLDDRNERFGAKMKDFELIGFKTALIVGKGLADGKVEIVQRQNLQKREIAANSALDELIKLI